ncbi:MAG TPA: hypothetical protein VL463_32180 [Kofleriaceae bacterium]|nr:hypothetical protein [Kofleriaceae bacterium]
MKLVAWQWSLYRDNHANRANLVIHALTNPLFLAGTIAIPLAIAARWWLAPLGLVAMIAAIALQGRGHAREAVAPVPFRGPTDVVARIFVEQWITWPRFVASGGFTRAWRARAAAS